VKATHKAGGSDTKKVKYEQQFELTWKRLVPCSEKWDKAFAVLQEGLEACYEHMQISRDQRVASSEIVLLYGIR